MPLSCDCYGGCWGVHAKDWPTVTSSFAIIQEAYVACWKVFKFPHGSYVTDGNSLRLETEEMKAKIEEYIRGLEPRGALSFSEFREANVKRCEDAFGPLNDWSPTDWGCALAGEVGELCNLLKKMRRGEKPSVQAVADEIADVQTYLDLLAARLDIDLGRATIKKFNEVSAKRDSKVRL